MVLSLSEREGEAEDSHENEIAGEEFQISRANLRETRRNIPFETGFPKLAGAEKIGENINENNSGRDETGGWLAGGEGHEAKSLAGVFKKEKNDRSQSRDEKPILVEGNVVFDPGDFAEGGSDATEGEGLINGAETTGMG